MRGPALFLLLLARPTGAEELCPGIRVEGGGLSLTAAEKRLVCGDPESEAWREVPRRQAESFLRAFLQARGRHSPEFSVSSGALVVRPGRVTAIRRLLGRDMPPGVDLGKLRRVVGRPLTPAALDGAASWAASRMQEHGWGCAEAGAAADPLTGELVVTARRGRRVLVGAVEEPALRGLDPGVFRRYEAFVRGRPYDRRLFDLTSERIIAETLFLSSHYELDCASAGARIVHRVAAGPPRLVRIGVGVDTEGYARLRARWTHSLIGARASSLQATFLGSSREQSLEGFMRLFPSPAARAHLLPRAALSRQDERRFETLTADLSLQPASSADGSSARWEWALGPAFQYARTVRGLGTGESDFLALRGRVSGLSHLSELHAREPREGWHAELDLLSRAAGLRSEITAHRVSLSGEGLWNLGGHDPPLAVLGLRGLAGVTITGAEDTALAELPPSFRFFPGGDADYRGVGRGELAGDAGFFTLLYQGLELRAGDVLPLRLQPLLFLDAASGGRRAGSLDPELHYAPGFGLRWPTLIGSFRATLARDLVWDRDPATPPPGPHWQFFFSYGREF